MKKLNGIHHVTAITSSAEKIYQFFTNILGLRLVKKTINQDDINTYHLFFADDIGSAGTDMTFFDFNGAAAVIKGTNEISKTSFRVATDQAIDYWHKRFKKYQIEHFEIKDMFGRKTLEFRDFDNAEYVLFSDEFVQGIKSGIPWLKGPVPNEYGITGLGPIFFRVNNLNLIHKVLVEQLLFEKMTQEEQYTLYETGLGGNGAGVIVEYRQDLPVGRQGFGGIHHVAFRVDETSDLDDWIQVLNKLKAPHSGHVDRFYFKSLYTRLYPGMLFEFATEGPGFIDDEEDYEILGETLALPPKFRGMRDQIEKLVRHIETKRSDKLYNKEYIE